MIKQSLLALLTALASLFHQSVDYVKSHHLFTTYIAAQTPIAQHQAVQIVQQQTQLTCGVCRVHIAQDAQDIIATGCNGVFHATHIECMRTWFEDSNLGCPTCRTPFSESNLEHVLLILNDGDAQPVPQPSAPVVHDCAICYDSMLDERDIRALPCAHIFHANCMQEWLQHGHDCPTCRGPVN